ncbi:GntR family transcriptional regulator [Curtobacterium sp. VKM Ac-1376]|uniref:GntR family transcriptional regulator n=1 Tax=Curtobacterium sp. VKM Ac-1376 TaxID=123312 RepID=UPI00188B708C|nr:GntR family transcriptional regulator [Curtobacterium sp. VKM Ac-1376]MBF4616223.1 GntR family transcriptional regulator [Curtobacterium sp. VKM Ac-1376]
MPPKYETVLKGLSQTISSMQPGDRLPSEQELAVEYGVSNMTVRRALEVLSTAKRIVGIRGRGTFVAQPSLTKQMTLASFTESMRAAGMTAHAKVLGMSLEVASDVVAERLNLDAGAQVFLIDRLRFGDDTPLSIDRTALPADRFPGLLGHDLTGSLYELLGRKYGVELSRADSRIAAVAPAPADAKLLDVPKHTPCLRVRARGLDAQEGIIEATVSLYRGDLYELNVGFV